MNLTHLRVRDLLCLTSFHCCSRQHVSYFCQLRHPLMWMHHPSPASFHCGSR